MNHADTYRRQIDCRRSPGSLCIEDIVFCNKRRNIRYVNADDDFGSLPAHRQSIVHFPRIFIIDGERSRLPIIESGCDVVVWRKSVGSLDELGREIRINSGRDKKSVDRRIDPPGTKKDVVGGVSRLRGSNRFFKQATDFIAGPIAQPVLHALEDTDRVIRDFSIFLQKLRDDFYSMLAKLFPLPLPLPAGNLRRDLFFGARKELRAFTLEEKIVAGKRSKNG